MLFFKIITVHAQDDVRVRGFFLHDSVTLGVPTPYVLTCSYPLEREVLFPDSTYNFSPFEWVRKVYAPSREDDDYLYDSAVYYLTTFELTPTQKLRTSVIVRKGVDTTSVYSERDSIYIAGLITSFPPEATAQPQTDYQLLHMAFNYPYAVALTLLALTLLGILFFVFRKPVQRRIQLYFLQKKYEAFEQAFYSEYHRLQKQIDKRIVEQSLFLWKDYLESLEKEHYAKLTTREIHAKEENNLLKRTLETIDRIIYAGYVPQDGQDIQFMLTLKDVAYEKYKVRKEALQKHKRKSNSSN